MFCCEGDSTINDKIDDAEEWEYLKKNDYQCLKISQGENIIDPLCLTILKNKIMPSVFSNSYSVDASSTTPELHVYHILGKELKICITNNVINDSVVTAVNLFRNFMIRYVDNVYDKVAVTRPVGKIMSTISKQIIKSNTLERTHILFYDFMMNIVNSKSGIKLLISWTKTGKILYNIIKYIINYNEKKFDSMIQHLRILIFTNMTLFLYISDHFDTNDFLTINVGGIPLVVLIVRLGISWDKMMGFPMACITTKIPKFSKVFVDPNFDVYKVMGNIYLFLNEIYVGIESSDKFKLVGKHIKILASYYSRINLETNRMLNGELSPNEIAILLEERRQAIMFKNNNNERTCDFIISSSSLDDIYNIMYSLINFTDEEKIKLTFSIDYSDDGLDIVSAGTAVNTYIVNTMASHLASIFIDDNNKGFNFAYCTNSINDDEIKYIAKNTAFFLIISYIYGPSSIKFSPLIYKFATGEKIVLADVVSDDMASGIESIKNMSDEDAETVGLDTIIQVKTLSGTESVNIDPDNNIWTVNKNNVNEYINLLIDNKINTGGRNIFRKELESYFLVFREFFDLGDTNIKLTSYDLVKYTYCGDTQLEFDEWYHLITYDVHEDHNYLIIWFKQYVKSMSTDRQSKLTEFITGNKVFTRQLLDTKYSGEKIKIKFVDDYEHIKIPTCTVCSLYLTVPMYPTFESMVFYFDIALDNFAGFQMV